MMNVPKENLMANMNRLGVARNPYQGMWRRVLCVCSGGVLRSPTAAWVLGQEPYNYNTRAVGLDKNFALIFAEETLFYWASEIVCMEPQHKHDLNYLLKKHNLDRPIICLDIPDTFAYRDPELVDMIRTRYDEEKPND
jgi:predicted protein tyrosine phosphatase